MHCKFKSSGQQKWLSKTSSNNVNAIYKGKKLIQKHLKPEHHLACKGKKNQISWKVHKHKVLFTLHKAQVLALNVTFKIPSNISNSDHFCRFAAVQIMCNIFFSLRQNNSSNNTASTSLNTMSSIWRDFFRKNRFFFPHLLVI